MPATKQQQVAHESQTAPIKEYRVLWTTQKTQKIKKWHDGFLRLHTFNNRVLVYDDHRNLVADRYLKNGVVEEGEELAFEHHLVTVEEYVKTLVQDLSPVFSPAVERRRARLAAAANQTPAAPRTPASVDSSRASATTTTPRNPMVSRSSVQTPRNNSRPTLHSHRQQQPPQRAPAPQPQSPNTVPQRASAESAQTIDIFENRNGMPPRRPRASGRPVVSPRPPPPSNHPPAASGSSNAAGKQRAALNTGVRPSEAPPCNQTLATKVHPRSAWIEHEAPRPAPAPTSRSGISNSTNPNPPTLPKQESTEPTQPRGHPRPTTAAASPQVSNHSLQTPLQQQDPRVARESPVPVPVPVLGPSQRPLDTPGPRVPAPREILTSARETLSGESPGPANLTPPPPYAPRAPEPRSRPTFRIPNKQVERPPTIPDEIEDCSQITPPFPIRQPRQDLPSNVASTSRPSEVPETGILHLSSVRKRSRSKLLCASRPRGGGSSTTSATPAGSLEGACKRPKIDQAPAARQPMGSSRTGAQQPQDDDFLAGLGDSWIEDLDDDMLGECRSPAGIEPAGGGGKKRGPVSAQH